MPSSHSRDPQATRDRRSIPTVCLPASTLTLSQNDNVLLLTYNVTYWDARSGWKDTLGNSAWDARQQAYVKKWSRNGVFTPQVVIDGVADGIGRKEGEVTEILSKAIEARNNAAYSVGIDKIGENEVRIASEQVEAEHHDVLVIVYDPKSVTVKVEKGPNKRKKMEHRNVVEDVVKIEEWSGGVRNVSVPQIGGEGLERVVVVQQGQGGVIVAAVKI